MAFLLKLRTIFRKSAEVTQDNPLLAYASRSIAGVEHTELLKAISFYLKFYFITIYLVSLLSSIMAPLQSLLVLVTLALGLANSQSTPNPSACPADNGKDRKTLSGLTLLSIPPLLTNLDQEPFSKSNVISRVPGQSCLVV